MLHFTAGKLLAEIRDFDVDKEVLTVREALEIAAPVCGFTFSVEKDKPYLNGSETTWDTLVSNNDIVLISIPNIKGNQIVVSVSKKGGIVKKIALPHDETLAKALEVAGITYDGCRFEVNGAIESSPSIKVFDDDVISVIPSEEGASRGSVISEIRDLLSEVDDLLDKLDETRD